MKRIMLGILMLFLCACAIDLNIDASKNSNKTSKETEIKLPNDIRWVTNSSEYKILCEQTYKNAWENLSSVIKAADSQSVIIMDLDETVLDNSKYQIGLMKKNESYNPESWSVWVNIQEADLVPGVKEFIDNVRKTNVRIVFLSNRMAKNELPTIENMKALNIYEEEDIFMLRMDKPDKKYIRRLEVLEGTGRMQSVGPMNVLAYFGDARHDFPDPNNKYIFGENMFMLPNPMYGKW